MLGGSLAGCASAAGEGKGVDLLVFAPHPDDEVLGCAGILRRTWAEGKTAKIVIFTSGDGFPGFASRLSGKPVEQLAPRDFFELARYRQDQSRVALKILGGRIEDLLFLGYPDSELDAVYLARGSAPVRQKFTGKSETYATDRPAAPYTHDAALSDVVGLIRRFNPARICVTHPADRHPDHQAAFKFVKEAVAASGSAAVFETYLVHGGSEWPWPLGSTPESPFEAHDVKGERIPLGVPWPPSRRVPLSPDDIRVKLAAIRAHSTHLEGAAEGPLAHEKKYLESFVKSEEVFWPADAR